MKIMNDAASCYVDVIVTDSEQLSQLLVMQM